MKLAANSGRGVMINRKNNCLVFEQAVQSGRWRDGGSSRRWCECVIFNSGTLSEDRSQVCLQSVWLSYYTNDVCVRAFRSIPHVCSTGNVYVLKQAGTLSPQTAARPVLYVFLLQSSVLLCSCRVQGSEVLWQYRQFGSIFHQGQRQAQDLL